MNHDSRTRYVLLNGPSASGRSTCARLLLDDLSTRDDYERHFDRFNMPIVRGLAGVFDYTVDVYGNNPQRDTPTAARDPVLFDVTYRDARLAMAEFVRATFSPWALGKLLARRVIRRLAALPSYHKPLLVIVPDLSYDGELDGLGEYVDASCVLVLQLHRVGRKFDGSSHDSRGYVQARDLMNVRVVHNDSSVESLRRDAVREVRGFLRSASRERVRA
jgi:hypothetical protein